MVMTVANGQDMQVLYGNFAFHVQFVDGAVPFAPGKDANGSPIAPEMLGAFSDISGIEASMEHKVVRQGGLNYGARMLAGPVSFGTVILKRGVARSQTLWRWWSMFAGADGVNDGRPIAANRCTMLIGLIRPAPPAAPAPAPAAGTTAPAPAPALAGGAPAGAAQSRQVVMGWRLERAMPVKFRVGDLNAKGSDVAIEELHIVHEGLHVTGVVG